MILGLALALAGAGAGFSSVYFGLIGVQPAPESHSDNAKKDTSKPMEKIAFVPLDPVIISLGPGSANKHLRFSAQLEVAPEHENDVAQMMPRILDILNGYLRAVHVRDLEEPSALIRLRAQMLRRVQVVTGPDHVRDLLVTEFVLN